ncbi:HAD superfamily hydrolase (TIGR01490 family) [Chitinivorax tropicus]|uniref:HAD superfamily hydrolase (TIGR01490 family) n=1 Tax=Chitinivorax tropicus TaxID=714531 RepID=A0A840MT11_9PROT|nr:HAD family hydrolase [Chitinivorax tropicus]MBB5018351.1 HAD superfamily hydrolase (TIGR01490 family) [Chitinivorax tropicus]
MNRLVLFDLDHTLLAGDSDVEWPRFLIRRGLLDAEETNRRNDAFYEQYKAGTLDMNEFLAFQLAPLARFTMEELHALHADYMQEHILPLITDKARQLVVGHQAQGDLVVIITATNRFVTAPIAAELGVSHLIATEPEIVDGRYTGKPTGIPSFQAGKITRLELWLADRKQRWSDFGETWFYSDSRNDLPLLERVTHPVAVNPDSLLKAVAEEQGWPIVHTY